MDWSISASATAGADTKVSRCRWIRCARCLRPPRRTLCGCTSASRTRTTSLPIWHRLSLAREPKRNHQDHQQRKDSAEQNEPRLGPLVLCLLRLVANATHRFASPPLGLEHGAVIGDLAHAETALDDVAKLIWRPDLPPLSRIRLGSGVLPRRCGRGFVDVHGGPPPGTGGETTRRDVARRPSKRRARAAAIIDRTAALCSRTAAITWVGSGGGT